MNELKIFENSEFGQVRTIEDNDKILFCGSDVAKALGYARPNDAIKAHCRATVKHSTPISGKMQEINYIPEGDVYRLIVNSKLPTAEKFERWVFDEVLPTIRKHGAYIVQRYNCPVYKYRDMSVILLKDLIQSGGTPRQQESIRSKYFHSKKAHRFIENGINCFTIKGNELLTFKKENNYWEPVVQLGLLTNAACEFLLTPSCQQRHILALQPSQKANAMPKQQDIELCNILAGLKAEIADIKKLLQQNNIGKNEIATL